MPTPGWTAFDPKIKIDFAPGDKVMFRFENEDHDECVAYGWMPCIKMQELVEDTDRMTGATIIEYKIWKHNVEYPWT